MGSHLSHTAKTYSRTTPLTNSGITVIDSVETVIVLSNTLSRRKPENTPSAIDVGTMRIRAKPARISEFQSAAMTVGRTGTLRTGDSPQSPVTKLPAQVA